jgi:hypothetical protein
MEMSKVFSKYGRASIIRINQDKCGSDNLKFENLILIHEK